MPPRDIKHPHQSDPKYRFHPLHPPWFLGCFSYEGRNADERLSRPSLPGMGARLTFMEFEPEHQNTMSASKDNDM